MNSTHTAPVVECHGLRVDRGGRSVLHGLDLTAGKGSVTGILGPSGSGKTTLLRSIVGVQKIADGRVTVSGHPAGDSWSRRHVAYTTQAASVYRDLTVEQNLRYFARLAGVGAGRVEAALDEVSLGGSRRALAGTLSGGQLSRVSLGCALVSDPDVLILDEPTVGLDPVLRQELWRAFRRRAESGTTILVSSHVMDEASRCDDLILLRSGRILVHATPARILATTGAVDMDSAFLALVEADSGTEKDR